MRIIKMKLQSCCIHIAGDLQVLMLWQDATHTRRLKVPAMQSHGAVVPFTVLRVLYSYMENV
jgi:hypothetical protein